MRARECLLQTARCNQISGLPVKWESPTATRIASRSCRSRRLTLPRYCWTALIMPEAEIRPEALAFGQHQDMLCT